MTIDVESLYGRRDEGRWNRVAASDILERMTWSAPDKVALFQTEAIASPSFWPSQSAELHARTAPQSSYVGVPTPLLGATVQDDRGQSLAARPGVAGEAVYPSPAMMSG
jgi:hypothetical protein